MSFIKNIINEARIKRRSIGGVIVLRRGREKNIVGDLEFLLNYFSYVLKIGKEYESQKGSKKININPKNIKDLISNLNKSSENSGNSESFYEYIPSELEVNDFLKNNYNEAKFHPIDVFQKRWVITDGKEIVGEDGSIYTIEQFKGMMKNIKKYDMYDYVFFPTEKKAKQIFDNLKDSLAKDFKVEKISYAENNESIGNKDPKDKKIAKIKAKAKAKIKCTGNKTPHLTDGPRIKYICKIKDIARSRSAKKAQKKIKGSQRKISIRKAQDTKSYRK